MKVTLYHAVIAKEGRTFDDYKAEWILSQPRNGGGWSRTKPVEGGVNPSEQGAAPTELNLNQSDADSGNGDQVSTGNAEQEVRNSKSRRASRKTKISH